MNPDQVFASIRLGQASSAALDALSRTLEEAERAIELRVYQKLGSGEALDPQLALQAWMQKHALALLRRTLKQNVRAGVSAGRHLEGEGNG